MPSKGGMEPLRLEHGQVLAVMSVATFFVEFDSNKQLVTHGRVDGFQGRAAECLELGTWYIKIAMLYVVLHRYRSSSHGSEGLENVDRVHRTIEKLSLTKFRNDWRFEFVGDRLINVAA